MTDAHWPYPLYIGHRGAGSQAPENTLAAFRAGARLGFRMFECDVKLSRDGVPFLLHDDTLERTTNGRGNAAEQDWDALSQLDAGRWHGREFAGEPPASLQGLAHYLLANAFDVNLELKPNPGQGRLTGQVVATRARLLWQDQGRAPLLSSFDVEALRGAQDAAPELPRALLLDRAQPQWPRWVEELGCVAVVGHHAMLDASTVNAMQGTGLHVLTYTVNRADEARRLLSLGVCGLITDVALAQAVGAVS